MYGWTDGPADGWIDIFKFAEFSLLIYLPQIDNAPESDRTDLLSELEVMKKLKPHPHVIKLIGCVTKSGEGITFKIISHVYVNKENSPT